MINFDICGFKGEQSQFVLAGENTNGPHTSSYEVIAGFQNSILRLFFALIPKIYNLGMVHIDFIPFCLSQIFKQYNRKVRSSPCNLEHFIFNAEAH